MIIALYVFSLCYEHLASAMAGAIPEWSLKDVIVFALYTVT